jgi:hypothetical protein
MNGSTNTRRLSEQYAERYGAIHPKILRHLIAWVLLMRESFDGDLDMMVVLAVIGDRAMKDGAVRDLSYRDLLERPQVEPKIPLTNRKSIADSTGIPRETVRRKVATLVARGWVIEQPDGSLLPTRGSAEELQSTSLRSFEILGRLAEAVLDAHQETAPVPE